MMIRMRPCVLLSASTISQDQCFWHDVAPNNVKKSHFLSIRHGNDKEFFSPAADTFDYSLWRDESPSVILSLSNNCFIKFVPLGPPMGFIVVLVLKKSSNFKFKIVSEISVTNYRLEWHIITPKMQIQK